MLRRLSVQFLSLFFCLCVPVLPAAAAAGIIVVLDISLSTETQFSNERVSRYDLLRAELPAFGSEDITTVVTGHGRGCKRPRAAKLPFSEKFFKRYRPRGQSDLTGAAAKAAELAAERDAEVLILTDGRDFCSADTGTSYCPALSGRTVRVLNLGADPARVLSCETVLQENIRNRGQLTDLLRAYLTPAQQATALPPLALNLENITPEKVELGRNLFFDKILSGNRNIACATCHHPKFASGDGVSLAIGQGGTGLGPDRRQDPDQPVVTERVPRNAPALFNLAAKEITSLFHDGRLEFNANTASGIRSPVHGDIPPGIDDLVALQALLPLVSETEMAGRHDQNEIGAMAELNFAGGMSLAWEKITARVVAIDEYWALLQVAYPDLEAREDVSIVHLTNAIGAFERQSFLSLDAPFDRFLDGDETALSPAQHEGMNLFYETFQCSSCHTGRLMTDQKFHALALPSIGIGKEDGDLAYADFGRARVTGNPGDKFKFKTPSLRNVALTGPWGHNGAYSDLSAIIRHHLDAVNTARGYNLEDAVLSPLETLERSDSLSFADRQLQAAQLRAMAIPPTAYTEENLNSLVAFMNALSGDEALQGYTDLIPETVPSDLPVDR